RRAVLRRMINHCSSRPNRDWDNRARPPLTTGDRARFYARACLLLTCLGLLTAASPAFTARSAVLISRSGRGSCICCCQSRSASAVTRMVFNPSRISAGPRPSERKPLYFWRLMPLRKQNSGTVKAARSSEDGGVDLSALDTLGLLYVAEAAHKKQMG